MESLPFDVHRIIFSFLTLKEQVRCRQVCKSLKESVELNLQSVTHLALVLDREDDLSQATWSYAYDQFYDKPFHFVLSKDDHSDMEMWSFLGNYCPNLQVVDAADFEIYYSDLLEISNKLTYFYFEDIIVEEEDLELLGNLNEDESDEKWPEPFITQFDPFENLQGFKLRGQLWRPYGEGNGIFNSAAHAETLRREKKTIATLAVDTENPYTKVVDTNWYESLAACNLRCLELRYERYYPVDTTRLPPALPQSLAHNLVELYFSLESVNSEFFRLSRGFFSAPFPNLKYFYFSCSCRSFDQNFLTVVLDSAPRLKTFGFFGIIDFDVLEKSLRRISLLEDILSIKFDVILYDSMDILQIYLPPKIEEFVLRANRVFRRQLMNSQLSSLRVLDTAFLINDCFKAPNLENVVASFVHEPSFDLTKIFPDLPKIKLIKLQFHIQLDNIQSLIDSLSKLETLEEVLLSSDEGMEDQVVIFKQRDFSFLKRFTFQWSVKFVFHPLDIFDTLVFDETYFSFRSATCKIDISKKWVSIEGDPLTKVEKISFKTYSDLDLLPFVKTASKHSQVKHVIFEAPWVDATDPVILENLAQFVEWLCSIDSLRGLTSPFDQDSLKHFLSSMKTSELSILRIVLRSNNDLLELNDELHRLLNSLIEKSVIASFFSHFTCKCSPHCPLAVLQQNSEQVHHIF